MKLKRVLALVLVLLISFACASVAQARPRYAITVDITNQIVTVYRYGSFEEDAIVRQMICSTGYGTTTPKGNFVMPEIKYPAEREEWYYFGKFECYAKYASRIDGPILFHSILFGSTRSGPTYASVSALGEKASHGCVRLRVPDSKWIAENCPPGTQVRIFESEGPRNEELRELLKNSSFYCEELSYDEFKEGRVLISYGSKLPQVKDIQDKLNKLGFKCGQVDGYFGERTADAVEAWEESMGYEPNGMLVPDEYDALMAAKIPEPTPTPSPTPVPTPSPTPDISKIEGTVALANAQPYLNMRANPDVKSGVITRLYEGMPVQVLEKGLVWSKVKYEDTVGWVGSDYIKIVREADET